MPNWSQILLEINNETPGSSPPILSPYDIVRRRHLVSLHKYTGRNIISYYSGFLSKPDQLGTDINDEDKNGLMLAIYGLNRKLGLDIILHTPGGSIAVAETIVSYLKHMFGDNVRAIVPQIAMSAGTMIACSCKSILMGKQSSLGPVDPQMQGIPAAGVMEEFKKAYNEIVAEPRKVELWQFIIRQYPPSYMMQCENAVSWAKSFVEDKLKENMLKRMKNKEAIAKNIVENLTDFSGTRSHDRHIHYEECRKIGLKIELMEKDQKLQDLILTVHHCYMHALMNTPVLKIIENHGGEAFMKNSVQTNMPFPMMLAPQPVTR